MELSHDEIRELLPAYALGAVTDDEAAAIRDHILGCEECMQAADGFAETSSKLALAVPSVPLPAGFADRVMEVALEGRAAPEAKAAGSRRWRWVAAFGGAALLVIAAVMTFQFFQLREDQRQQEQVLAALSSDQGVELTGTPGVRASVVPHGVGSVFAASGLERAPDGKTYQLWLIDGDRPVSAGTFETSDGLVYYEVAQPIEDYDAAAVTIEQDGGVEAPTTEPILAG